MTDDAPHPYFLPLPDERLERLAAHLHRRWQEHEAVVAQWSNPTPLPWDKLEPDVQRGYRAMAVAADEFFYRIVALDDDGAPLDPTGAWAVGPTPSKE